MANRVSLSKMVKALSQLNSPVSNSNSGSNSGSGKVTTVVAASTPAAIYTASSNVIQGSNSGSSNSGSGNSGSSNSGSSNIKAAVVTGVVKLGKLVSAWATAKAALKKLKKLPKNVTTPVVTTPTTPTTPATPTNPTTSTPAPAAPTLEASRVSKSATQTQTAAMVSTRDFTKNIFSSAERFKHGSNVAGKFGENLAKAKVDNTAQTAMAAELGRNGLKKNAEVKAAGDRALLSTVSKGMESVKKMRTASSMLAEKAKMVAETAARAQTSTEVKNTKEAVKQTTSQVLSSVTNILG